MQGHSYLGKVKETMNCKRRLDLLSMPLFQNVRWGEFLFRPNRFIVECRLNGQVVRAHLPNPGRLWELLIPGRAIGLMESAATQERKTIFTAVAIEREDQIILLHTHKANMIVQGLIEQGKIKGLEGTSIIRTEVKMGHSRFDLLLQRGPETILLEVKSCSLFGTDLAMFPDAITQRGRKHLLELAAHADKGMKCSVVFLVHTSRARFFLPDFHTDYEFARTFVALKDRINYRVIAIQWDRQMTISPDVHELTIPWDILKKELHDRGSYLIIFHIPQDTVIKTRDLMETPLRKGYYIQVNEAGEDLSGQMQRHLKDIKMPGKGRKTLGISTALDCCMALPIRSGESISLMLCNMLERSCEWSIPMPVRSASPRMDRLFAMKENPIHSQSFIDILQHFRMDRLKVD